MHLLLILFAFFSSADQTVISRYGNAKGYFWNELYSPQTQQPHESLYCQKSFTQKKGLNIEHVFAASWMKNSLAECRGTNRKGCRRKSARFNLMEADLHNMYPTITQVNSNRGSKVFGETEAEFYNENCPIEIGDRIVEPPDYTKGRVARAILYMAYEYQIDLDFVTNSPGFKKEIIEWNCKFKPTPEEILRNKHISVIQGTLNPFILNRDLCN